MIFIDELKPMKLYKRPFYLPIDMSNKKKGNVAFLLTPNYESSAKILNNPMINGKYYNAYYIEKDITYYINQEGYLDTLDDKSFVNVIHENKKIRYNEPLCLGEKALTSEERNNLKDSDFGIPEERKFPLTDEVHIRMAIRYFHTADDKYKAGLAKRINKKAKSLGMKISVSKDNPFYEYADKSVLKESTKLSNIIKTHKISYKCNVNLDKYKSKLISDLTRVAKKFNMPCPDINIIVYYDHNEYLKSKKSLEGWEPAYYRDSDESVHIVAEEIYDNNSGTWYKILFHECIHRTIRDINPKCPEFILEGITTLESGQFDEFIEKMPPNCGKMYMENAIMIKDIIDHEGYEGLIEIIKGNTTVELIDPEEGINEADNAVLNDPKRYLRSLKYSLNKARYQLNKTGKGERNNIGTIGDARPAAPTSSEVNPGAKVAVDNTPRNPEDVSKKRKDARIIDVDGEDDGEKIDGFKESFISDMIEKKSVVAPTFNSGSEEGFYEDNPNGEPIWNSIVKVDDKNYRERSEMIIVKLNETSILDSEIYLCTNNNFKSYRIPGGSTEPNISIEETAIKEAQEEARINTSNCTYLRTYYDDKYRASKTDIDGNIVVYEGMYTHICIGLYKDDYTGVVSPEDADPNMVNNGKFYKLSQVKKYLNKNHIAALEEAGFFNNITENYIGKEYNDYTVTESYIRTGNTLFLFNDFTDENILTEAAVNVPLNLRKILYKERFRTNKEVFDKYNLVTGDVPSITKTYINLNRYKSFNLFIDLSYYNQTFFKNLTLKMDKAVDLYFEFINRFIQDKRLEPNGYTGKKTVLCPLFDWTSADADMYNYTKELNPISMILRLAKRKSTKLQQWKDIEFVFVSSNGYFKIDFSQPINIMKIKNLINILKKKLPIEDDDQLEDSKKAILVDITDKLEKSKNVKIDNLTGDTGNVDKDRFVDMVKTASATSSSTEDALKTLDDDEYLKNIINKLASEEGDGININVARSKRINALDKQFQSSEVNGKKVSEILSEAPVEELPSTKITVDSVNDEWKDMKYMNFEKVYDVQSDIVQALYSFSKKRYPVSIIDLKVDDTSTSEDYVFTYTCKMEAAQGERFTLKFDVPKFKNNKFMRLRGNDKTIQGQLAQLPISKTDMDRVQIVSNYNKIFVYRYGDGNGKSYIISDKMLKALNKYNGNKIKVLLGDNTKICNKYELPIDYIDLASVYSKISIDEFTFYFNQDELRELYKDQINESKGLPIGYNNKAKEIIYSNYQTSVSAYILYNYLFTDKLFEEIYNNTNSATKYNYSKAKILGTDIPVIVICSYNEGLTKTLKRAGIKYDIVEKKDRNRDKDLDSCIRFNDAYMYYQNTFDASLLMNGLKECNTEDYSISEINSKSMWLDFLDIFGNRLVADGLDNFYDCMIDPITEEVCKSYKLPTEYCDLLLYANNLLSDNKYVKHISMAGKRYRTNELIAAYTYKALADSYGIFMNDIRRGKKSTMTIKQSEIIDRILADPTTSDLSKLTPTLEIESANAATTKGLTGMNAERAYSLDKRTFDKSMVNVLGLSTGFAANVGITRQTTMDMNITGKRGYIKTNNDPDDMSITKTFTITEALTPFGTRSDDPFRSAMTFVQTAKHGMRVKKTMPLLISNGADQALPYMISDTFAFKAKDDGIVKECNNTYMVVEYKDGTNDFIDLRSNPEKNSDGGFYIELKLDTDLKQGSKFKKDTILAYDKYSFSDKIGGSKDTSTLAATIGPTVKVAIMNTDEGFEDSAIISDWLSDAMSSNITVMKDTTLSKDTNVLTIVKKGQPIQEGDPLIIFQNAFTDQDVNILLKNLSDEDEDSISDLGRITIKSKVTGIVKDIKVYRTCEISELSPSLKKIVNSIEKESKDLAKVMDKYKINEKEILDPTEKLEQTGKLKHVENGVLIEFYLEYNDKLSVGDKIIYYSANKGTVKDIFPKGNEPYALSSPNEPIHSLVAVHSINGRMVGSIYKVGSINRVLIELDKKVKEMAGIPCKPMEER